MIQEDRRERQAARARQDILEAAARVFGRGGYADSTVESIAREAGYSPPGLYTYFKGKAHIYASLLAYAFQEAQLILDGVPAHRQTFAERLEWLIERLLEYADKRRELFMLMADPGIIGQDGLAADLFAGAESVISEVERRLQTLMADGVAEGVLRPAAPEDLSTFLVGTLQAFVARSCRAPDGQSLQGRYLLLRDLFLHGAALRQP